jgi:hypothetical protein
MWVLEHQQSNAGAASSPSNTLYATSGDLIHEYYLFSF